MGRSRGCRGLRMDPALGRPAGDAAWAAGASDIFSFLSDEQLDDGLGCRR